MTRQEKEHWPSFWAEYQNNIANKDEQSQVLRTRNKQPIDQRKWQITLTTVGQQLELQANDILLDLCCGNGLFCAAFKDQVALIEAVDISPELTELLAKRSLQNVTVSTSDMRAVQFSDKQFSKVLWYAGIQYIDESDIVSMIRRIRSWMKRDGILMIGDIPDRSKLWNYFNDETRRASYFKGLAERKPIIGSWLEADWLERLCLASGFVSASAVPQHEELIYSDFRFDLIART